MITKNILLTTNVNKSQIRDTGTHWEIKNIPVTVDDAVMNGVHYGAADNAKGMPSMIGKPVCLSHPIDDDGNYVSGREGVGLENFFSGGTITNVYNIKGVNYADARIKKSVLQAQEAGAWYVEALKSKEPIGVSTGLTIAQNEISGKNSKGEEYAQEAIEQAFDHLAMLEPSEAPAGGKATFMRFNAADSEKVMIANVDEHLPEQSLFDNFMEKAKAFFAANHESSYNVDDNGHLATNQTKTGEVANVKDKLKACMKNMGMPMDDVENMDEEAMLNAMAAFKKPEDKKVETKNSDDSDLAEAIKALNARFDSVEEKLSANSAKELDTLAEQVSQLEANSIPLEEAKKLSVNFLKNHLAANGHINVNAAGGYAPKIKQSSIAAAKMPGVK